MKMNTTVKVTLGITSAILVAAAVGSASVAKERKQGPRLAPIFLKGADVNGDKQLTLEEVNTKLGAIFISADADGNGALTKSELFNVMETHKADRREKRKNKNVKITNKYDGKSGKQFDRIFTKFDADQNGLIERAELEQQTARVFVQMDKDSDGKLVRSEIKRKRMKKRASN